MDFSDDWRSLWPVSGVFAAPKLISIGRAATFGPLLFSPSSPPLHLLTSPSLALHIDPPLPPSSFIDGLRSFFRCPDNEGFLPAAEIDSLAADVTATAFSPSAASNIDPIPYNNLVALRCRSGSSLILFFPTGENSHSVGYVRLTFGDSIQEVRIDQKDDIFKQSEGFKNPYHRILKISVVPVPSESSLSSHDVLSGSPSKPLVEGFLVAATLYSLNWFRVETRVLESGEERPFLVPLAKQGFESSVKHVCWSTHLAEESATLLESGELCWFNLYTKRCGTIRVTFSEDDPGEWLSCEFGGQPWTVIVTCSKAIILVDLRSIRGSGQRVLAKIENDRFLAVCKASFNEFHIAAVTEHQLHLFDIRKPLVPILTWSHSLKCPRQISIFRLSELRSSDEFQRASEYGFAVLVGSLWNDEFSLFCFGPKESGLSSGSSLYSWELPSCLCLSSQQCVVGDKLVVDILSKENCAGGVKWQQLKNILAGFCVVPYDLLTTYPVSPGFAIIRLTLSGKLEMQWFQASTRLSSQELDAKEGSKTEYPNVFLCCNGKEKKVSTRYDFIELKYLFGHMQDNLFNALFMHRSRSNYKSSKVTLSHSIDELMQQLPDSLKVSALAFVNDITLPSSIMEITYRRLLNSLQRNLVPLAFSNYCDLFQISWASTFEFLEVPSVLPHHKFLPFFTGKPSRRGEKWLSKSSPGENYVGPVLPLPVLLELQKAEKEDCSSSSEEEIDCDLLNQECEKILQAVFPDISLGDNDDCFEWNASEKLQHGKSYFVYEPANAFTPFSSNSASNTVLHEMKQDPRSDQVVQKALCPDKKFSKFICGIAENSLSSHDPDMLGPNFIDMSPIKLDFDSSITLTQPAEQKVFKSLKRQFSKWQESYKPYLDFCSSFKIPKLSN